MNVFVMNDWVSNERICYDVDRIKLDRVKEIIMNTIGFKMIVLIGLLSFGLSACAPKTTSTQTHPESGYDGGFGGNGGHDHQPKSD